MFRPPFNSFKFGSVAWWEGNLLFGEGSSSCFFLSVVVSYLQLTEMPLIQRSTQTAAHCLQVLVPCCSDWSAHCVNFEPGILQHNCTAPIGHSTVVMPTYAQMVVA